METVASRGQQPRPASTVMLVRDGLRGIEVYLTRRNARSSFVPDAYVFPGGAVDPQDRSPDMIGLLNESVALPEFKIAALRELFEEAGVLLATTQAGTPASIDEGWRRRAREYLRNRSPFSDLLRDAGLYLDVRRLHAYSNWVTPVEEPIRFDTHFFAAPEPAGQTPEDDEREVAGGRWFDPFDALARAASGELTIIFPTRKHLERIAAYPTANDFLDHAATRVFEPLVARSLGANEFGLPEGIVEW